MEQIRQELIDLIHCKPKHYAKIINNCPVYLNAIIDCHGDSIPEKTYNFIHGSSHVCKHGNKFKFASVTEGYKNCGAANSCKCTKESVSTKVSLAKQQYTKDQLASIQAKREQTSIEKYGVVNNGQTAHARAKHREFYEDTDKIRLVNDKITQTKLARYNNPTYNNSTKIKETFKDKYQNEYWANRFPDKDIAQLMDKEKFTELYQRLTVYEIAELLNVHVQTVYKYLVKYHLRDPFKSAEETEVVKFIQSLGITNIVRNSRKLIPSRKEIDIYLPDFKLAIEYNGVFWHHDEIPHITHSYHYDKYQECKNNGIQLLTIFSCMWRYKKDIVKQIIINKLGINSTYVAARKCEIVKLKNNDIKDFLNKNHIQGHTISSFNYGLIHNDTLVAVMTFSKSRVGIGKHENAHELVRFASSVRVAGGASKLLKHFINLHNPSVIVSYSDNEWNDGNLYNKLGFTLEKEIPPSYWYVSPKGDSLMHRYNFAKHKLVSKGHNSALSERDITREMGLLRIWDCGKKRWEWHK